MDLQNLTVAAKQELALAILLWKDFKSDGEFDVEITFTALKFCKMLGIQDEFEELLVQLPPMEIKPRR